MAPKTFAQDQSTTLPEGYCWMELSGGESIMVKERLEMPKVHRWSNLKAGHLLYGDYLRKQLEILKDYDLAVAATNNAKDDCW